MKLNKSLKPFLSMILLVVPFSIVMSLAGVSIGLGFVNGWFFNWLKSLLIMMPIGYLCALIFLPVSQKVMSKIEWQ